MEDSIAFLIITFGNNFLENCVNSIRKFHNNKIIIVNNDQNTTININNNFNVLILNNEQNSFELGAIWFSVKNLNKNFKIKKLIIIHNSMEIIEKITDEILDNNFISIWKTIASDYSPVIGWVEEKLIQMKYKLDYDKLWNSITGCCCIISVDILNKLIEYGFDRIYANNKSEAVGTEILFGYLIENVLNIDNKSIHDSTIIECLENQTKFKFIKKIGSGQGNLSNETIYLFNNYEINNLENLLYTDDLNECYINLITYIDNQNNNYIEQLLLSTNNKWLRTFNPKLNNLLPAIRHRLFTKKYFPSYYISEKNDIIIKKKLLF